MRVVVVDDTGNVIADFDSLDEALTHVEHHLAVPYPVFTADAPRVTRAERLIRIYGRRPRQQGRKTA